MKICADENVAPKLTGLIKEVLLSSDMTIDTVDEYSARGVEDQIWVRQFAAAGGEAIVGGDFALTQRPHEIVAIRETGLRLIVLDQKWPRQKRNIQISYLFYWWPHIEEVLRKSRPGECYAVPWGWGTPEGAIKPIKVDIDKAYKQMRKNSNRAR